MASPTSTLGFREVLQTPAVKRLWFAQIVSIFGDFLAIFAIFSLVTFQLHGTPDPGQHDSGGVHGAVGRRQPARRRVRRQVECESGP